MTLHSSYSERIGFLILHLDDHFSNVHISSVSNSFFPRSPKDHGMKSLSASFKFIYTIVVALELLTFDQNIYVLLLPRK